MATDAWGIEDGYHDIRGEWHETVARGSPAVAGRHGRVGRRRGPAAPDSARLVRAHGTGPSIDRPAELVLEDGTTMQAVDRLPPRPTARLPRPASRRRRRDDSADRRRRTAAISSDRERSWGWAVQLYADPLVGQLGHRRPRRPTDDWRAGPRRSAPATSRSTRCTRRVRCPTLNRARTSRAAGGSAIPLYLRIEDVPGFDPADNALADAVAAGTDAERLARHRTATTSMR